MNITETPKLNNTVYNIQKQHEKDKNCNRVPKVTNHVCSEFEMEVLNECTQRILLLKNKTDRTIYRKKANNTNQFSHRLIRECARDIHNREYWNEKNGSFIKKWQKEKLTCSLMFSNKWVSGFLRRENARRMGSIDNNNDHNNNAIDIHIQSGDQVETMKITASADVNLAVDNGNGNITVSHCDDGNDSDVKVSHYDGGVVKVSHCDDGNVEGCNDNGDGGNECGEQVDDNNGPFAPYDDDLLRDIIAFINGKGSL